MNWLFILNTANEQSGGVVSAPIIIRDGITDFYNVRVDLLHFKETNIWNRFFKIIFSQPKIVEVNPKSNLIEITSISQLLFWMFKNMKNYNLFIIQGIWPYIYMLISLIFVVFKKPFCFHSHGALDPFDINKSKKSLKTFLGFFVYKFLFNCSSGIIFTSKLEAFYAKTFGSDTPKFIATLSTPSIKKNKILTAYQEKKIRKNYNIKSDEKILLFLNRIDQYKGLDILIKSLSNINFKEFPLVLVIAGKVEKKYKYYIEKLIKKLNLEKNIRLVGFLQGNKKIEIMKISDLYVLPTCKENFGIAIVEALQNKLPVIITKEVYISEIIIESKAGYICDRNSKNLSKLIKNILKKRNLIDLNNCKICFEKNFSKEKCAKEHFKIYSEMVSNT